MRVLIAHNRYRVPGGEERHVELLDQGLRNAGIDVQRFERDSAELERSSVRQLGAAISLSYRPGGGGIGRMINKWQPDIVHFHNLWPLLTPAALRIARQSGAAVVLTVHNYRFACPGGTLFRGGTIHEDCIEGSSLACAFRNPRGSLSESLAYGVALEVQRRLHLLERWVDAFIAPSEFVGRMLARAGLPNERIHVIHHGLPLVKQSRPLRRFALFAGRLSEEKGVLTLLEASRIATEVPLVLAGAGPLIDHMATAPVSYLGRLSRHQLGKALSESAFSIVPSECYESFSYAILEAFAAGIPVIGTRLGGIPELVKDNVTGLLVPPNSPRALAEAMQALWRNPDLTASLGRRAFLAARRLSVDRQISRTTALYESALSAQFSQKPRS